MRRTGAAHRIECAAVDDGRETASPDVLIRVMRIREALRISLIAGLTLIMSGCGRSYHIKGRVVFLSELQGSAGFIKEVTGKDLPQGGNPIVGAKVRMFHDLNKEDKPVSGSVWEHDTLTDENGFFDTSDYAAPSKESKVGLEISREGYKAVYTTYIDDSDVEPQVFFVVLVPHAQSHDAVQPTAK